MMRREGAALALATAAAFGASMLAVSEHVSLVTAGYELAAARREGEALHRETVAADRRVATLRLPTAVAARAKALKLDLELPRQRSVLSEADVARLVAPAAPAAQRAVPPVATPPLARRPATEVQAR